MKKPVKKAMGGKMPAPKHVHGGMSRPSTPGKGMMQRPVTPGRGTTPVGGGRPGDFMATTDQGLRERIGPMPIGGGSVNARVPMKGSGKGLASVKPGEKAPLLRNNNPIPGGTGNPNNPYVPLKKGGAAKKTTKGMKKK